MSEQRRHHRTRTTVIGGLLAAVVLVGCDRAGTPAAVSQQPGDRFPVTELSPGSEVDRSRPMTAHVSVTVEGAANFTWDGVEEMQLTRVGGVGLNVNLLSLGFMVPLRTAPGSAERFRWAFDLLHTYADEPGTFTLDSQPVNSQGLRHMAFLIFFRAKDAAMDVVPDMDHVDFYTRFDQIERPCTATIGTDETSGSLDCPELADAEGRTIAMTVEWSPPAG